MAGDIQTSRRMQLAMQSANLVRHNDRTHARRVEKPSTLAPEAKCYSKAARIRKHSQPRYAEYYDVESTFGTPMHQYTTKRTLNNAHGQAAHALSWRLRIMYVYVWGASGSYIATRLASNGEYSVFCGPFRLLSEFNRDWEAGHRSVCVQMSI